ncbi:ABC transporter ATP-binding protein [Streptomyces termitum]|uniref:ABC transporter ATP-binding protein n=1 Tax=Streptomyces termitum TaxID=67368 RepID=UPI0033B5DB44
MDHILSARGVDFFYGEQQALYGADFELAGGEVAAITGGSGAGKSSLLYCLAGVLPPARGTVTFDGIVLSSLSGADLSALRRERLGFVSPCGEPLPELTVQENAALPMRLAGVAKDRAHAAAGRVLEPLGMGAHLRRRAANLSGGQSRRVAVARALVHRPDVVFADEPTGALGPADAAAVLEEFLRLARGQETAVVLVTRDPDVAARADTRYVMADGAISRRVAV